MGSVYSAQPHPWHKELPSHRNAVRQEPFVSSYRRDYMHLTDQTALFVIMYPHIHIVDTLVSGGQEMLPMG